MNPIKAENVAREFYAEIKELGMDFNMKGGVDGRVKFSGTHIAMSVTFDEIYTLTPILDTPDANIVTIPSNALTDIERRYYNNIRISHFTTSQSDVNDIIESVGKLIRIRNEDLIVIGVSSKSADAGLVVKKVNCEDLLKLPIHIGLEAIKAARKKQP